MKKLSLQWRITLMTTVLICITCVLMNCLIGFSGKRYMDSIGNGISAYSKIDKGKPSSFNPENENLDRELTIIVSGAQASFNTTNWYITVAVSVLGGILAYFVSGRALKSLKSFASQVENVQPNNLADMKLSDDVLPEFKQFCHSFNNMLDRLDNGFTAQRQFTGNAAHELRTPLALTQAQIELFSVEHPNMSNDTAEFLALLQEQNERMSQMTKTLLEMSELRTVECKDTIEIAPMIEEIFTDLAPLAEKKNIRLEYNGNGMMIGSDTLIYRLLFNLTENAIRYNRENASVIITVDEKNNQLYIRVKDNGYGIPEQYKESIFQPFFRVDKSRSRAYGGVGLGLSLVWEIVLLHNGTVKAEKSDKNGTVMLVTLPKKQIAEMTDTLGKEYT